MIAVPSKGRLRSGTIRSLLAEDIPFDLWVHESEVADYSYVFPDAHIVAHQHEDISAIRAAIVDDARLFSHGYVWQIDDDVSKVFYRSPGRKHEPVTWTDWIGGMTEELTHWPTVALAGPSLRQYARSSELPAMNGRGMGVTWLRLDGDWNYRPDIIEDWDIVFQIWQAGLHTLRLTDFAYDMPQMGSNAGGMHDAYEAGWQAPRRAATLERWPQYVSPRGTEGDIRMNRSLLTSPERVP